MKMNIKYLQSFYWVARLGSYTRAAEQLNVSESSIYRSVRYLERACGVELISREKGRLRVSHAGRILQEYGERIHSLHSAAEESIAELVAPRRSVVLFGVSRPFAIAMARSLAGWKTEHPDGRVGVVCGVRGELHVKVLEGELDFALAAVVGLPAGLTSGDTAFEDEMVVVGPAGHPLSKRRAVSLDELSNDRLITFLPGSSSHSILTEIAEETRTRLNIVAEVDQWEIGIELVAAGVGISVRSRRSVAEAVRLGRLSTIPVTGFPRRVPYAFICRSGALLSAEARSLTDYATACLTREQAPASPPA